QRRQPAREQPTARTLGLQQRPEPEQMVRQGLVGALSLAPELEAAKRPGQLVALGGAPRHEVAEGAQLVLLLGRDEQHAVGAPAGAERDRCPRARAEARPGE